MGDSTLSIPKLSESFNMTSNMTSKLGFKWQYLMRPELSMAVVIFTVLGWMYSLTSSVLAYTCTQITGFDRNGNKLPTRKRRRRRNSCPMIVEDFSWGCSDLMNGEDIGLVDYDAYEYLA